MSQTQTKSQSGEEKPVAQELREILSGYSSGRDGDTDFLQEVMRTVESEIGVQYLQRMKPEFNRSHVLAYRKEEEVYEAKWLIRFRTNAFLEEFPPEGSKMQGSFRQLVYGDSNGSMSAEETREVMALEEVLLARITQSRGMEQQKLIKEMRQEQSLRRDTIESSNGLTSRLKKAFK
ncbi:hypothetical protein [Haloarchaeobius sp. DFWS5]|uniref:hypothetical protein n=1 Tax=Haloarchaeobius sp. DFWS5 TaxID=3446114 RepID=UPI003EC144A4